jgi:iron complex outermembrane receptor protein
VNLRVGITRGPVGIELFTTNLFNNHAYTNIQDNSVLTSNFAYAAVDSELLVGLRDLRTFGLRLHYAL